MSKLIIESEKIAEIRSSLWKIRYKTELIPASILMGEIFKEVRKIEKLLPREQAK